MKTNDFDVSKIVKMVESAPFNFKVISFEVFGKGPSPAFFCLTFGAVTPCARHELERKLEEMGFKVSGGGTFLGKKATSDITFSFPS